MRTAFTTSTLEIHELQYNSIAELNKNSRLYKTTVKKMYPKYICNTLHRFL
jgi:hypothetical protein